jgi:glycosyltransferase involved in cell wall biosynthesis
MFIESMAKVVENHNDVVCLIVGRPLAQEPNAAETLKDRIETLNLENKIILMGFRNDVHLLMKRADIFCLCSRSEGMPNVVLEAMAAGCPVVSTNVGDVSYVIQDEKNGLLIRSEDRKALTGAVKRLLDDPDLSERLRKSGRETIEKAFSCEQMAREMETNYNSALNNRRAFL